VLAGPPNEHAGDDSDEEELPAELSEEVREGLFVEAKQNATLSEKLQPQLLNVVGRLQAGEFDAGYPELVQLLARPLFSMCRRFKLSVADSDDVFMETVVKVVRNIDRYDSSRGRVLTWITKIHKNELISWWRKHRHDAKGTIDNPPDPPPGPVFLELVWPDDTCLYVRQDLVHLLVRCVKSKLSAAHLAVFSSKAGRRGKTVKEEALAALRGAVKECVGAVGTGVT
jgi:RNA polymerase sigma factor (sigma-70 family)